MRTLSRFDSTRTESSNYRRQRRLNRKKLITAKLLNVNTNIGSNSLKLSSIPAKIHRPKSTLNSSEHASYNRPLLATNQSSSNMNKHCNSNDDDDDEEGYGSSLVSAAKGSSGKYVWKKPSLPTVSVQAPVRKVLHRVNHFSHPRGLRARRGVLYLGKQSNPFHNEYRESRDDEEESADEGAALLRGNDVSLRSLSYLNLEVSHSLSDGSSGRTGLIQVVDFGGFEEPAKSDEESSCVITEGTSTDSIDVGKSSSATPSASVSSLEAASSAPSRVSTCTSSTSPNSRCSLPEISAHGSISRPSSRTILPSSSSSEEKHPLGSHHHHLRAAITPPESQQIHSSNTSLSMEVFDKLKNEMDINRAESDGSFSFGSSSNIPETGNPDEGQPILATEVYKSRSVTNPYTTKTISPHVDVFNKLKERISMNRKDSDPPTDFASVCTDFSGHSSVRREVVGYQLRKAEMKRNESDTTSSSLVGLLISPESTGSLYGYSSSDSPSDSLTLSSADELDKELVDIRCKGINAETELTNQRNKAEFVEESLQKSIVSDEDTVNSEKTIDFDSEWNDTCIKSGDVSSEPTTEKVQKLNHITPMWNASPIRRRKYQVIASGGSGSFELVDTTQKGREFDLTSVVASPVMSPESNGKLSDVKVKLEPAFQDICEVAEVHGALMMTKSEGSSMQRKNTTAAEILDELGVVMDADEKSHQAQAEVSTVDDNPLGVGRPNELCVSTTSRPSTKNLSGDDSSAEYENFSHEDWDCDEDDDWSETSQPFGSFTLHEEVFHDMSEKTKPSNFFTQEGESDCQTVEKVPSLNSLTSLPQMNNTDATSLPSDSFRDLSMGVMMNFSMLHFIARSSIKVEEERSIDSAPPSPERNGSGIDALKLSKATETELETDDKTSFSSPTRSGAFRFNTYDETIEDESSEDSESDCGGGATCCACNYSKPTDSTQNEKIGEVDSSGQISDIAESEQETGASDDGTSHFDLLKSFWSNQWKEDTEEKPKHDVINDATADIRSNVAEAVCDDTPEDEVSGFQGSCVDSDDHQNNEEDGDQCDYPHDYLRSFHRTPYLEDIIEVEHESDFSNDSEDSEQSVREEFTSVVTHTDCECTGQIIEVKNVEDKLTYSDRGSADVHRNELKVLGSNDISSDNNVPHHCDQSNHSNAVSNKSSDCSPSKNQFFPVSRTHENKRESQVNQKHQILFRSSRTTKNRYLVVKKRAVVNAKSKKRIKFGLRSFDSDKLVQDHSGVEESSRPLATQESEHFEDDVDNILFKAMHVLTRLEGVSHEQCGEIDVLSTNHEQTNEPEVRIICVKDENPKNCLVSHATISHVADDMLPEIPVNIDTSCSSSFTNSPSMEVQCSISFPNNEMDGIQERHRGEEYEEPIDQCEIIPENVRGSVDVNIIGVENTKHTNNEDGTFVIVNDSEGKGRSHSTEENLEERASGKIFSTKRSGNMTQKLLDENIELAETLAATQSELVKLNQRLEILTMERNQLLKKNSKNNYLGIDDETRELLEWLESTDEIESI
ncbi:hypothetical protein ACHAXS_006252 [Conticribra weissflogii]